MRKTKEPAFDIKGAFAAKMAESKIDPKFHKLLGYKPVSEAPKELPYQEPGIIIPYFDLQGKPTKFYRYRYLKPPKQGGFARLVKKPLRYVQPSKSINEIYLPPVVKWKEVAADPLRPLIITEGEFKSASACLNTEHACIGLGGVWSWKSNSNRMPMLPMFKEFAWRERPVYIVYDSDAATNPMVMQAENALAKALTDLGAEPFVIRLPNVDELKKTGLDDYLVHKGAEAFDEILEAAEPWVTARELHELNEEVIYVRNPGLIMELKTLQRMSPSAFTEHAFSTRVFYEEQIDGKGNVKMTPKSAPKEWLKWGGRAEAPRVTYAPGEDRITEKRELNVWPGWGVEPEPGDIKPWKELLAFLFRNDPESADWMERWLAYPLQHPGAKMYSSPVLWGLHHGTGKSFIGYCMFKIYGTNATEISDEEIYASHNEWAENKQFVMGDEITSKDKRTSGDRLKSMITRQLLRLNPKFIPAYTVPDCINYYFTSNHPDSFFLEDGDRRFFIHEVVDQPLSKEFYKRFEAWIGKPGVVGPGAAALFHHLLTLDLKGMDASDRAPTTRAKLAMLDNGRSDIATWVNRLKEDPDSVLRHDGAVIPFALWRSEDLLLLYDSDQRTRVTANGLSREMTRQGFRKVYNGNGVPTKRDGQVRLWAIRNKELFYSMNGSEVGIYYDHERDFKAAAKKEPKHR